MTSPNFFDGVTSNRKEVIHMTIKETNPCEQCPKRNILCDNESRLNCALWNKFSDIVLSALMNDEEPPRRKPRWSVFK